MTYLDEAIVVVGAIAFYWFVLRPFNKWLEPRVQTVVYWLFRVPR